MKQTAAAKLAREDVGKILRGMRRLEGSDYFSLREALETGPADIMDAFVAFRSEQLYEREDIDDYTDAFLTVLER